MSLVKAVQAAVKDLALTPADQGAVRLAIAYATAVDAGEPVEKCGPHLLQVLEALGATPRARAALVKGGKDAGPSKSPLDELRAKRAARLDPSAALDAPAS